MMKLLLRYKRYMVFIMLFMIIEPSINSVLNFWLQKLFNAATLGSDKIYILRLLTTGFLYWMVKRLINFANGVLKARYICNAKRDLKHRMFECLFCADVADMIGNTSSGNYISLFTNDVFVLEQRFFDQILNLFSGIFSIAILGSSFFVLNAKLAVAILFIGMIAMLIPIVFSKELNEKNLAYSDMISKFTQNIKEYLIGYPAIKNYSIEEAIVQKFIKNNNEVEDTKFDAEYSLTLANSVGSLLSWFMQFVAVGMGLMLVIKGEILIGTVIAAQSFASDLAAPLQGIITNINSIRSVKEIIGKFQKMSTIDNNRPLSCICHSDYHAEQCDITYDDLCLNINGKTIIDHFSFNFEKGKKYLIVGINGSGKTSLFKVLKKWFHNYSGAVYINRRDIRTMGNAEISNCVSFMNENVALLSGSVRDNVSLFREDASEALKAAVRDAHLNLNLDDEIVDEGRNISSGEQRRIEIARSLMESVPVLIFDEIVSTLDIETAYEIEKSALELKGKTVIFISHNFSGRLIRQYDDILVMEKGRLLAHGSYDELKQSCEYFCRICEIKFG